MITWAVIWADCEQTQFLNTFKRHQHVQKIQLNIKSEETTQISKQVFVYYFYHQNTCWKNLDKLKFNYCYNQGWGRVHGNVLEYKYEYMIISWVQVKVRVLNLQMYSSTSMSTCQCTHVNVLEYKYKYIYNHFTCYLMVSSE